ncbi:rCG59078 [Rattus norvegicus]|uniref:RCG59078 n=1 Tax=Rattus norvegicus TaxID=10116 RepID=A6JPI8_RAT|nr:rCG59078 [Rattus norvegicus]
MLAFCLWGVGLSRACMCEDGGVQLGVTVLTSYLYRSSGYSVF